VHARGRHDDPVGRIAVERVWEARDLGRDRRRDRPALDERRCSRCFEPVAQRETDGDPAERQQRRDLPQADVRNPGIAGATTSPGVRPVPRSASCGNLARRDRRGRITSATGRPRFEITTGSPVRSTSSRIARQRALNSDALMVRM
jgi:hypothetical protein